MKRLAYFIIFFSLSLLTNMYGCKRVSNTLLNKYSQMIKEDFKISQEAEIFKNKELNPNNPSTKLRLLRAFVSSVFDQLGYPTLDAQEAANATVSSLLACMKLFSEIARGEKKPTDLILVDKFIRIKDLKEKLLNDKNVENAATFLKKFILVKKLKNT